MRSRFLLAQKTETRRETRSDVEEKGRENERGSEASEKSEGESVRLSVHLLLPLLRIPSFFGALPTGGLITACHCCHGNSRSVKNALTPIVCVFMGRDLCIIRAHRSNRLGKYLRVAATLYLILEKVYTHTIQR